MKICLFGGKFGPFSVVFAASFREFLGCVFGSLPQVVANRNTTSLVIQFIGRAKNKPRYLGSLDFGTWEALMFGTLINHSSHEWILLVLRAEVGQGSFFIP